MKFTGAEERWIDRLGRLRDIVRQELIAAQPRKSLINANRVLDVGVGSTQALILLDRDTTSPDSIRLTICLSRFEESLADEPVSVRERVHLVKGTGEAAPELTRARSTCPLPRRTDVPRR